MPTGWKEIGPRGRGNGTALYGTTTAGGVAVEFRNPVQAADLSGVTRHRRLVLTLADRPRFVDALGRACGLN